MEDGLRLQTRRELLQSMIPQYREASTIKRKSRLLDAFTAATGYNSKYAMWLLNHAKEKPHSPQRPVPAITGRTSNTRCSWSGRPPTVSVPNASSLFFPPLSKPTALHERRDGGAPPAFSAHTVLARTFDHANGTLGTLLKQQISIRTFEQWKESHLGLLEAERARPLWH